MNSNALAKFFMILFGVGIFLIVFLVVKPNLDTEYTNLMSENTKLNEQLARLNELEANLATYQSQRTAFEEDNVEILNQFPAELRTEDAILYAKKLENSSDMEISTVGVAPGSLMYSMNGDNFDTAGLATVEGTDTTDTTGTDTTGDTTGNPTGDGTNAEGTDAAGNTSGDDLGIIEESQVIKPDYNLYDMQVSYDFRTSYEDLKKIFGNILKNKNKRNIGDIAITYDEETGKLIGNMTVNMYFVTGTDKVYEEQNPGKLKHGISNIFGTLKKSAGSTGTGGKKKTTKKTTKKKKG